MQPHPVTATPHYRLLALDLDGTLLDSRGRVSERNLGAVRRARQAGLTVTVCTGRGLVECRHVIDAIGQVDPVIVAGGAIVACPVTSRTLHRFAVDRELVAHMTARVLEHKHPVLILKDPLEAGYDYLVIVGEERLALDPVTLWWFEHMKVKVRYAQRLDEDAHPEHTVRVGACGLSGALAALKHDLAAGLAGRAQMHHFPAVVAPEHARKMPDGQSLHILEAFDRSADKWSAIGVLAAASAIRPDQIVAIGDEINDVPMIRGAGLGVAMGNAVPAVRDVADRHTLGNDEDGVAHAIDQVLSGVW